MCWGSLTLKLAIYLIILEEPEIIEDYPDDFPHPSCLIFGYTVEKRVIHVVVSKDEDNIGIITAYIPNLQKFEADLKTRKEQ